MEELTRSESNYERSHETYDDKLKYYSCDSESEEVSGGTLHIDLDKFIRKRPRSPSPSICSASGSNTTIYRCRVDRHSKVFTHKGLRDRRVRLSVSTALQFYDVQDQLGYDRPSKAIDWLIKKAKSAIDELTELPPKDPGDEGIVAADGSKNLGLVANSSMNFQNHHHHHPYLTSNHTEDLSLSLRSFQNQGLIHRHSQASTSHHQVAGSRDNHDTRSPGSGADAASFHRMVAWNDDIRTENRAACGGGVGDGSGFQEPQNRSGFYQFL